MSQIRNALVPALVSAGSLAALVVALGRLWTRSYFDTFGLPTSDLLLTTDDYAFRAKEALIMVGVAAVAAFAVWWFNRAQAPEADTDTEEASRPAAAAWLVVGVTGVLLVLFLVIQIATPLAAFDGASRGIQRVWSQAAIVVGLLVGICGGLLTCKITTAGTS